MQLTATGDIVITGDVLLDAGTNVSLATQYATDDVCLSDDATLEAHNGRGYISVSKRGKWFNWCSIPVSAVPNLRVFLALVDQIVGVG